MEHKHQGHYQSNHVHQSKYRVVINLVEVYTDGSEEVMRSALVAEEEREDRAEEKMQELLTYAEQY